MIGSRLDETRQNLEANQRDAIFACEIFSAFRRTLMTEFTTPLPRNDIGEYEACKPAINKMLVAVRRKLLPVLDATIEQERRSQIHDEAYERSCDLFQINSAHSWTW